MTQLLLLSGGIESISLAYMLRPKFAITIDYGQICAEKEIAVSKKIATELNISHSIIHVDCKYLGTGTLANSKQKPTSPTPEWWPFRNQLLITLAGMKATQLEVNEVVIGTIKSDDPHCDGTAAFIETMSSLLIMQEGNLKLTAPGQKLESLELIQRSKIPISLLRWAHSCHTSNNACGQCRGCYKYQKIFEELNCQIA